MAQRFVARVVCASVRVRSPQVYFCYPLSPPRIHPPTDWWLNQSWYRLATSFKNFPIPFIWTLQVPAASIDIERKENSYRSGVTCATLGRTRSLFLGSRYTYGTDQLKLPKPLIQPPIGKWWRCCCCTYDFLRSMLDHLSHGIPPAHPTRKYIFSQIGATFNWSLYCLTTYTSGPFKALPKWLW